MVTRSRQTQDINVTPAASRKAVSDLSWCDYTVYSVCGQKGFIHAVLIEAKRECVSMNAVAQV